MGTEFEDRRIHPWRVGGLGVDRAAGGKRAEEEGWRETSTDEGGGQLVICRCIVCGQDLTVYNPIILRRWLPAVGV